MNMKHDNRSHEDTYKETEVTFCEYKETWALFGYRLYYVEI